MLAIIGVYSGSGVLRSYTGSNNSATDAAVYFRGLQLL